MGLSDLIRDGLKHDPDSTEGRYVAEICVKYVTGVIDAYAFQRDIKRVDITQSSFSGQKFRLELTKKAYYLLNLKYAALNLTLNAVNVKMLETLHKGFGITLPDVLLLRTIFSRQKFRREMRDSPRMNGIDKKAIGPRDMERVRRLFATFQAPVMKHIRNKTYKKLRFVANSENSEHRDLHSEIMTKALTVYYGMMPTTKSEAHVLNYLRLTCTNHVLNIIDSATTEKKGRLKNTGKDGYGGSNYELKVVSENQQSVAGDDMEPTEFAGTMNDNNRSDATKLESEIVVSRLLNKYKGRKRAALNILCGNYDQKFTKWLLARGRIKDGEDHQDLQQRVVHTTFIGLLADFLGVLRASFEKFVAHVGRNLKSHLELA
jgi:hypothetical protein